MSVIHNFDFVTKLTKGLQISVFNIKKEYPEIEDVTGLEVDIHWNLGLDVGDYGIISGEPSVKKVVIKGVYDKSDEDTDHSFEHTIDFTDPNRKFDYSTNVIEGEGFNTYPNLKLIPTDIDIDFETEKVDIDFIISH